MMPRATQPPESAPHLTPHEGIFAGVRPARSARPQWKTTLCWGDWLNHDRLLGYIGRITPDEAEANIIATDDTLDTVS